jgi:hypothetical protein
MTILNNYEKVTTNTETHYWHTESVKEDFKPILNLLIVVDAQSNKLRLKIEPNHFFSNRENFTLFWKTKNQEETGELYYKRNTAIDDYLFAADIVRFLNLGFDLVFCGIQLFNEKDADVFTTVFKDYHQLVQMELLVKT